MATKSASVSIVGISPLLMHSFPLVTPDPPLEKRTPEEQAEFATYRDPERKLYVPGVAVQRAMVSGATFSKGKGRATLQKSVAACVMVTPERLLLTPQEYTIDARPVVIPSTKGRVMRYRPRFDDWTVAFEVEWDDRLLTAEQIRQVLDDTGSRVGLLDFRPEKKGPFGRFVVSKWAA